MTSITRQRLLASTLLMGAAALSTPAMAQTLPVPPEADPTAITEPGVTAVPTPPPPGGDIIVTGSRIARPDLTSTSPLAVVNDEEFRLSGASNVEQVINTLPQVAPGVTAFSNNPGNGTATINLRGLGSTRNLVLVNGRRYIFFGTSQTVDVNTIPAFLIDSVDVVTGGASAVYGSDALAGVVNFKLRGLRGFETGSTISITERGDGRRWNVYGALGTDVADGRGNITVFAEYFDRAPIFQSAREFSRFAQGEVTGPRGQTAEWGEPVPGLGRVGSALPPWGRIFGSNTITVDGTAMPHASGLMFGGFGATFRETPGVGRPYINPDDSYNYAPANYLMIPQQRFTLGGYGDFEIAPFATAYMEVNFINNRVQNELAATPSRQAVNFNLAAIQPLVDANTFAQMQELAARQQAIIAAAQAAGAPNPFGPAFGPVAALQPGEVRLTVDTRFTGIGPRNVLDDRHAYRMLGGFRGNITPDLNYDLYYMYARTRNSQIQDGNISRSNWINAAQTGLCNVFGDNQVLITDECRDAVSILAQNTTISALQVAQGSVSGNVFRTPWATSSVGFAAGVEWRKMNAEFIPDTALSSGDVVGFNAGQPTQGSYDVRELFGELRIPLVEDNFIHRFELSAAGRYSDYSLEAVGGVWTYAVGAELAPVPDITFRAQYQRAVRAPNVAELFGGQSVGFPTATDPCAQPAAATDPTVRALCIATGVPAGNVGQPFLQPNQQIQGSFGGNPNLEEEVGDTFTVGAVFRPRFVPRLNMTVDYYDIKVKNVISAAGGGVNNILHLCYNVIQNAQSAICQLIARDPQGVISGPPFVVTATQANLAVLESRGIDFQVDYNMPLNFSLMGAGRSRLTAFLLATRNLRSDTTPLADLPDDVIHCLGRFGQTCGNPTPKWGMSARLSLQDGPITTSLRWRHMSSTRDDNIGGIFAAEHIRAYNLFDLALSANVSDNMTMGFGVHNLLKQKPPVLGNNAEQANTFPSSFNVIGRDYYVSATLRF
jgi:iron complex outermembrane recepter protein